MVGYAAEHARGRNRETWAAANPPYKAEFHVGFMPVTEKDRIGPHVYCNLAAYIL
jgi:hypothetical protein